MPTLLRSLTLAVWLGAFALTAAEPAQLISGIDPAEFSPAIRPQDDFNAYVNSAWSARTPIPPDKARWGSFQILHEESQRHQHEIITALASRTDLRPDTDDQRVGDLYNSLMDEARAEQLGAMPVQELLAHIDRVATTGDLVKLFAAFRRAGINSPLAFWVGVDSRNSTQYAAFLGQSGLGLPNRNYYLDVNPKLEELRARYPEYIARLFTLAGRTDGTVAAAQVYGLEYQLATIHWSPEDNRDATKTDNLLPVDGLAQVSDRVAWSTLLAAAGLGAEAELYVRQPDYFEKLGRLLGETPLEVWQSYLRFHVLNHAAPWLSADFVQAQFEFFGVRINGVEQIEPRWQRAVRVVNAVIGDAVGQAYVARHFPPEAKQRMDALVQHLLRAFETSIDQIDWMSPETKARAQEKRRKLTTKIGYPEKWKDYSALVITRDDALGNLARAAAWDYQRRVDQLSGPVDRTEWFMTPQTVNAYFSPRLNEIVFPAAILQPPFFNLAADDAVNFGGIGVVIGHEIGHAFDDQGRKTDGNGNLHDWWTAADAVAFTTRAQTLVEQYNGFELLPDLRVNGRLTLGENIGDLTGVSISHLAYQMSLDGRTAPVIDGLTGAQRFFLGFAQIWRSKMRPEAARQQVLVNPHAPAQFRVIGPLRNFAPFYEAFAVKEGDGMYLPPDQRVRIW